MMFIRKLAAAVCVSAVLAAPFARAEIDLSGLSFQELLALSEQVNLALWQSDEWQEVTVPAGMYKIGEAIPAGKWVITAAPGQSVFIEYGDAVNNAKTEMDAYKSSFYEHSIVTAPDHWYYSHSQVSSMTYELIDGAFILFEEGSVVFTPFAGYDFVFK